jgi:hypothetical protein
MNFFDAAMKGPKPPFGTSLENHITHSECASYATYNRLYDDPQTEVTSSVHRAMETPHDANTTFAVRP